MRENDKSNFERDNISFVIHVSDMGRFFGVSLYGLVLKKVLILKFSSIHQRLSCFVFLFRITNNNGYQEKHLKKNI